MPNSVEDDEMVIVLNNHAIPYNEDKIYGQI